MRARLASGNRHKLEELRRSLPGVPLELLERRDFPPETGGKYLQNARAKAQFGRAYAAAGEWVIGEDSGIEAVALGGAPGIASARWARDGVAALLRELEGAEDRRARYVCVIVAVSPAGEERVAEGVLEGTVSGPPRGREGFGYDPIFVPTGETCTVAELGDEWKAVHSHRARAAAALRLALAQPCGSEGSGSLPVC